MTKSKPDSDKAISRLEEAAEVDQAHYHAKMWADAINKNQINLGTINRPKDAFIAGAKWLLAEANRESFYHEDGEIIVRISDLKKLMGEE